MVSQGLGRGRVRPLWGSKSMSEVTGSLLASPSCWREGPGGEPALLVAAQLSSGDLGMVGVAHRCALSGGEMGRPPCTLGLNCRPSGAPAWSQRLAGLLWHPLVRSRRLRGQNVPPAFRKSLEASSRSYTSINRRYKGRKQEPKRVASACVGPLAAISVKEKYIFFCAVGLDH